ncbi:aldehyde dehydrogenase family protein [Micromonospora sp. NPDC005161]
MTAKLASRGAATSGVQWATGRAPMQCLDYLGTPLQEKGPTRMLDQADPATADVIASRSPHEPADVIGSVRVTEAVAVRAAVDQARAPGASWAATPAVERAERLSAAADALAGARHLLDLIVREVGKPVGEARGELSRAVAILRYNAQLALDPVGEVLPADRPGGTLHSHRLPHGVVGLLTPWNFPVAIPLWKAAPALALGNAVVLKPSPDAVVCAEAISALLGEHLPPGLFTLVHGGADTGAALVDSADAISFTGSTTVGRTVAQACAGRCVPVQAEMGGHNPAIVLPGADPRRVAAQLAGAIAGYSGQKCTATRRIVVVGDPAPLAAALAEALDALPVGDPADPATVVGPLINAPAQDRVRQAVNEAIARGAVAVTKRRDIPERGWYVAPTLLTEVPVGDPILREEVFGPVASVVAVQDDDEAVAVANDVPYGLTAAIVGPDLERARAVAAQLRVGMVKVNEPTTGVSYHAPFGGSGISSFGPREQGKAAREMYTRQQTVTVSPAFA